MNKKEIADLKGDKLSRVACNILTPENRVCVCDDPRCCQWHSMRCSNCGGYTDFYKIHITWAEAMKYRTRAVKLHGQTEWEMACFGIMYPGEDIKAMDHQTHVTLLVSTLSFMASKADEAFFLRAAVLCETRNT